MAKKKNIFGNRRKKNAEHLARTEGFVRKVQQLFDLFCKKAAKIALSTDFNPEKEFKWADFPAIQQRINTLTSDWAKSLNLTITSGIKQEWDEANHSHDIALKQFFDAHTYTTQTKKGVRKYFEYNKDAVTNFIERKNKGLSLSENLWNLRDGFKDELESAIATGIGKGISAAQLSKSLSQYLRDFQALKRDYSEKFGKQTNIKNCEYKAARLARTEINMSYREAEQERWRNEDFVVGYEIKRSGTPYPCPVCENLQGKYPKDFKWNGWHPNCRCYAVPILKTEEEFWADEGESTESENEVTELPENFKDWVEDNRGRIRDASIKGTLPDWVENNENMLPSFSATARNLRLEAEYEKAEKAAKENPTDENRALAKKAYNEWKNDRSAEFRSIDYGTNNGVDGVRDFLSLYSDAYKDDLRTFSTYEIADIGRAAANTDCRGGFKIQQKAHNGLVSALKKALSGTDLTDEDYMALQTIYHEILHNKYGRYVYSVGSPEGLLSECCNEIVSRYNFPTFVENIGGKAIVKNLYLGYGYGDMVPTLVGFVDLLNIDLDKFCIELEKKLSVSSSVDVNAFVKVLQKANGGFLRDPEDSNRVIDLQVIDLLERSFKAQSKKRLNGKK